MPIEFTCVCGKRFRAKDGSAGRAFHCPSCRADVIVPAPDAVDLGIETEHDFAEPEPPSPAEVAPAPRPSLAPGLVHTRPSAAYVNRSTAQRVVVIDFDMPFGSLVWLLVKISFAAIPAMLLVYAITFAFVAVIALIVMAFQGLAK